MLILASASPARCSMLERAGIVFKSQTAEVNETTIKNTLKAKNFSIDKVALKLAEAKAQQVAINHPQSLILGSDQMLICGGEWFDKPLSIDHAREQLCFLRGRTHRLYSAAVLMRNKEIIWQTVHHADLTMKNFSDTELNHYLNRMGETVLQTVGCYRLEDGGAPLFAKIQGDPFVIQGLPLLEVLTALSQQDWENYKV